MKFPEQSESEGGFEPCPAGTHIAACYEVIDLGTQVETFNNEERSRRKIWIGWELPEEKMTDGRPYVIGCRYTLSSYVNARLRKHLESWRGKTFEDSDFGDGGFDIKNVIGVGCMLLVTHNESGGKTYANVGGVMQLPKGTKSPTPANEQVYFSLDDFDADVFAKLSERMQGIIRESPEYETAICSVPNPMDRSGKTGVPDGIDDEPEDDIPF